MTNKTPQPLQAFKTIFDKISYVELATLAKLRQGVIFNL
jgi:hypothetical protein